MPRAVLDANVAIGLALGGVLSHLARLYDEVLIPPLVIGEIAKPGQARGGSAEVRDALSKWLIEAAPDRRTLRQLPSGVTPADHNLLALALSRQVEDVLSKDRVVRREATQLGFTCHRTLDLLLAMKRHGLITEVRSVLDQMRTSGFGVDERAYQATLRAAGEASS